MGIHWQFINNEKNETVILKSYLEIKFDKPKDIEDVVKVYLETKNLFAFLNNRKYIEFTEIKLYDDLYMDVNGKVKNVGTDFNMFIALPNDKKIDLPKLRNRNFLDNIESNFERFDSILIASSPALAAALMPAPCSFALNASSAFSVAAMILAL